MAWSRRVAVAVSRVAHGRHTCRPSIGVSLASAPLPTPPVWVPRRGTSCTKACAAQGAGGFHSGGASAQPSRPLEDSSPLRATPPRNVLDAEGILSPAIVQELQHDLELMQRQHGVQAVVVTVPGSTTTTPKAHATRIFQKWGIGSPLFHDGLLIMLSSEGRWCEIEVGGGSTKDLGLTHLLTKEWLGDLLQQVMVPNFRQGKYSTALVAGVRFTNRFLSAALDRGRAVTVTLDEGECAALNKVTASSARNLHTPLTKHIVPASMAPLAKRKLQAVMSGDASVLRLPGGMADPHRAWQSSRQEHGHAEPGFWQVWGNLFVLIGLGVALLRVMYDLEWGSKDSSEPEPEAPPDDLRAVPNQLVTARVLELTGDSTRTLRRTLVDLLDAAHTFDTQVFGNSDDLQLLTGVKPDASTALDAFRQRLRLPGTRPLDAYDVALDAAQPVRMLTGMKPVRQAAGGDWSIPEVPLALAGVDQRLASHVEELPATAVTAPKPTALASAGLTPSLFISAMAQLRAAFPVYACFTQIGSRPYSGTEAAQVQPPAPVANSLPDETAALPMLPHDLRVAHYRMRLRAREAAARTQAAALLTAALQRAWQCGADVVLPLPITVRKGSAGRDRVGILVTWPDESKDAERAEAEAVPEDTGAPSVDPKALPAPPEQGQGGGPAAPISRWFSGDWHSQWGTASSAVTGAVASATAAARGEAKGREGSEDAKAPPAPPSPAPAAASSLPSDADVPDWDAIHKTLLRLPLHETARYHTTQLVAPAPPVPSATSITQHRRLLRSAKGLRKLAGSTHTLANWMEREMQLRMWLGGVPLALQWAARPHNQDLYGMMMEQRDVTWVGSVADAWRDAGVEAPPPSRRQAGAASQPTPHPTSSWSAARAADRRHHSASDSGDPRGASWTWGGSTTGSGGSGASWGSSSSSSAGGSTTGSGGASASW